MIKFVKEADCPRVIKINNTENARKSTVKYVEMYRNISKGTKVRGNQQNWNNLKSQQLGKDFLMQNKACFKCGYFDHLASNCGGNPHNNIDDKGYWDNGFSRHMTGNISYLSKYEPYDGGYVLFGYGGGKITGKGSIKTAKLEFENVYFVKELKYNLFSVSQICDNKNSVLFTDSECLVLGKDFKLNDDTNVLLRTPRQHNMYSIDLLTKVVAAMVRGVGWQPWWMGARDEGGVVIAARWDAGCGVEGGGDVVVVLEAVVARIGDVLVNKSQNKTPYDLFNSRIHAIEFLRPFGCHVMILNTLDHMGKFDAKGDEGYFVGYSLSSKAFRVFNKRTKKVEENLHVDFLENKVIEKGAGPNWLFDIDTLTNSMNYVPVVVAGTSSTNILVTLNEVEVDLSNMGTSIPVSPTPTFIIHKDHPKCQIIGPVDTPIQTRHKSKDMEEQCFIATIKQKTNPELLQLCLFLCLLSKEEPKKIFNALKDPSWVEAMQEELLQFKIQNVWVLVDCPKGPPGFQDPEFPERVYKVEKAMYGLHHAPRAWYDTLSKYLLYNGFHRVLQKKDGIFLSQDKYVGDILKKFGYSDVRSANTPIGKKNPWGKDRPELIWIFVQDNMRRDILIVGSTMMILLLYRGEYSQWVERFMNYLEEQMDGEAMINSIKNGDQSLPRVTQVSIAGNSSTEQPPLKDKSMWSDQEKRIQNIDRLARSLLIQGLLNDIYSIIDSNKTAEEIWDALA
nr:ribonuclease H-like domain-containing protein [Tanacetum cinerariifolium]